MPSFAIVLILIESSSSVAKFYSYFNILLRLKAVSFAG